MVGFLRYLVANDRRFAIRTIAQTCQRMGLACTLPPPQVHFPPRPGHNRKLKSARTPAKAA